MKKQKSKQTPFCISAFAEKAIRPPIERMLKIHHMLQSNKYPDIAYLTAELETGEKTILRDIAFMKDRLELPIAFSRAKAGYWYTRPVKAFPILKVTEQELFALFIAGPALAHYAGAPFEEELRAGFAKLTAMLDPEKRIFLDGMESVVSFQPFAQMKVDPEVFKILTRAAHEHRALKFRYRNWAQTEIKSRHVHPVHVGNRGGKWYLFAFDLDPQDDRKFLLSRIEDVLVTGETFEPRPFDPKEKLGNSFTSLEGKGDYAIAVEFDLRGSDIVRDQIWHHTQEIVNLSDYRIIFKMRLSSLDEIDRWLMQYAIFITKVEPPELESRIQKMGAIIAERFATRQTSASGTTRTESSESSASPSPE